MSAKSAHNPSHDPRHNLNSLPNIEIPPPRPVNIHDPLITATRNWIAGDFTGLGELAQELYRFAATSHNEVTQAAGYMERLIGDSGSWTGEVSDAFRWSFGGDLMIAHDLAQVTVAIGQVIDNLTNNLASLETIVDNTLSPRIASGNFWLVAAYDSNHMMVARNLQGQYVAAPLVGPAARAGVAARSRFVAAVKKAKRLRREAATQLAVLCEPLNKNLGIYTSPDGEQREREGRDDGPLRPDQTKNYQPVINSLQQQFKAAITSGGNSGISAKDVEQTLGDIGKFGGDVNTIGGVVHDITAMQHASALSQAGNAGSTVEKIAAVARDLVIALEMEPIK